MISSVEVTSTKWCSTRKQFGTNKWSSWGPLNDHKWVTTHLFLNYNKRLQQNNEIVQADE